MQRPSLAGHIVSLANDVDAVCRFAAAGAAGSIVRAEWLSDSKVRPNSLRTRGLRCAAPRSAPALSRSVLSAGRVRHA